MEFLHSRCFNEVPLPDSGRGALHLSRARHLAKLVVEAPFAMTRGNNSILAGAPGSAEKSIKPSEESPRRLMAAPRQNAGPFFRGAKQIGLVQPSAPGHTANAGLLELAKRS